jgi:hypothetical protein
MNRHQLVVSLSIVSATFFATLAKADPGVYKFTGKGYTVTMSSDGQNYHGCDTKKRCIDLTNGEQIGEVTYKWKSSNNFVYKMEQIPNGRGKNTLKVYNPKGKVILSRVMTPVNGGAVMAPD